MLKIKFMVDGVEIAYTFEKRFDDKNKRIITNNEKGSEFKIEKGVIFSSEKIDCVVEYLPLTKGIFCSSYCICDKYRLLGKTLSEKTFMKMITTNVVDICVLPTFSSLYTSKYEDEMSKIKKIIHYLWN